MHPKPPITGAALVDRFGPQTAVAGRLLAALTRSPAGGRPGEPLLVVHTYFVLVTRVIAVELLAAVARRPGDAPSGWRGRDDPELLARLRGLAAGELPGGLEIANLFDADQFSWWAEAAENDRDLLDAVRALLAVVAELAVPESALGAQPGGDVLRDLYQALVPSTLRKALGEFLTPHWLAEACLARLREQGADLADGRVLDPTCGTGTFVVPVVAERLRLLASGPAEEITAESVQAVLDSVTGIDVNPVAVTAARANYVLALGELAAVGPLTLPVWRADSLVGPEPAERFDVVVGNPPWLTWTKLPAAWRAQSEDLWRRTGLWYPPHEPAETFSPQSGDIATLVFAMSLARYAKDGAHVGLLTPAALINGDPGGRAFRQFRLRPDQRDTSRYVDSLDVPFRAVWVDDWSHVSPFAPDAANKPIFLIVRKGEQQDGQTPGAVWTRPASVRLRGERWPEVRPLLREALGAFAPVDPGVPTSAWRFQDANRPELISGGTNRFTFGKGLDTRGANGVYVVDVHRPRPSAGGRKATVQVENRPREGRNPTVSAVQGRVESELVHPLLRGRDVQHWVARPSAYLLLPHDPAELDRPLPAARLQRDFPQAFGWLARHRAVLERRKAPPTRSWDMSATGDGWYRIDGALQHMRTGHVVVVREFAAGRRPAAALVQQRPDPVLGGRAVSPLVDHKLMLCSVPSREEALYLVATINSTPLQDLLASFVSAISVSPKSMKRLPIPDYDPADAAMTGLVELARQVVEAAEPPARAAELQSRMDAAVLKIIAAAAARAEADAALR